jgi:hypothetical protein
MLDTKPLNVRIIRTLTLPKPDAAAADVARRIIYITPIFDRLTDDAKDFVLWHEMGHIMTGSNEATADEWAFNTRVQAGHSLKAIVKGMSDFLDVARPAHFERMYAILQRALQLDAHTNENPKAVAALQLLAELNLPRKYANAPTPSMDYGRGAAARRERKRQRQEARLERKRQRQERKAQREKDRQERKMARINSRADKREIMAEARADDIEKNGRQNWFKDGANVVGQLGAAALGANGMGNGQFTPLPDDPRGGGRPGPQPRGIDDVATIAGLPMQTLAIIAAAIVVLIIILKKK